MNKTGAAAVAWVKLEGENRVVIAKTRPNHETPWGPVHPISPPMNVVNILPNITDTGIACVIWGTNDKYYFSREDTPNAWSPYEHVVNNDFPTIADVSFDYRGNPLVIAYQPKNSAAYSYHFKSTNGPFPVPGSTQSLIPKIIKNKQGQKAILWTYLYSPSVGTADYWFYFSLYPSDTYKSIAGMGFKNLDKEFAKDISASMNKDNHLAIIWNHYDSMSQSYLLKTVIKSDSPLQEDLKNSGNSTESSIVIDDEGNAVAVWIKPFENKNVVWAAIRPKNKGSWQGEPKLLSDANHNAESVQVDFNNGSFIVVWGEKADGKIFKRIIRGSTLSPKAEPYEWTPAVQLSPPNQNCWYPSIAFSEKEGIITWTTHSRHSKDYQIQVAKLSM